MRHSARASDVRFVARPIPPVALIQRPTDERVPSDDGRPAFALTLPEADPDGLQSRHLRPLH